MKNENVIFVEYDDNNIYHVKNAPDYGNPNGKLKWSENSTNPSLRCYFPLELKYKNHNIVTIK
jgi:hypothetical protein